MRPKKPTHASIEQVRFTRDGPTAVIEFADPAYGGVNLTIGDHMAKMRDQQVVDVPNDVLAAQAQSLRAWDNTVTEIPLGKPQIKFNRDTGQWLPQGEVLRCVIPAGEQCLAALGECIRRAVKLGSAERTRKQLPP